MDRMQIIVFKCKVNICDQDLGAFCKERGPELKKKIEEEQGATEPLLGCDVGALVDAVLEIGVLGWGLVGWPPPYIVVPVRPWKPPPGGEVFGSGGGSAGHLCGWGRSTCSHCPANPRSLHSAILSWCLNGELVGKPLSEQLDIAFFDVEGAMSKEHYDALQDAIKKKKIKPSLVERWESAQSGVINYLRTHVCAAPAVSVPEASVVGADVGGGSVPAPAFAWGKRPWAALKRADRAIGNVNHINSNKDYHPECKYAWLGQLDSKEQYELAATRSTTWLTVLFGRFVADAYWANKWAGAHHALLRWVKARRQEGRTKGGRTKSANDMKNKKGLWDPKNKAAVDAARLSRHKDKKFQGTAVKKKVGKYAAQLKKRVIKALAARSPPVIVGRSVPNSLHVNEADSARAYDARMLEFFSREECKAFGGLNFSANGERQGLILAKF